MKTPTKTDAVALLNSLNVADIEARLRELIAEEKSLLAILRSIRARERVMRRSPPKEVAHA